MKKLTLKPGTISDPNLLKDFNDTMNQNFTLASTPVSSTSSQLHKLTTTLDAQSEDGEEILLIGSAFTPPIFLNMEPQFLMIFKDGVPIEGLPWRYQLSGLYYNIYITNYDTELENVKINILC